MLKSAGDFFSPYFIFTLKSKKLFQEQVTFEDTFCSEAIFSSEPLTIENARDSNWAAHPCAVKFKINTYIGTTLHVGGQDFGSLFFSSTKFSGRTFSKSDVEFMKLLAEWIGHEVTRHEFELSLEKTRDFAVAATKAKSEFLANMSH